MRGHRTYGHSGQTQEAKFNLTVRPKKFLTVTCQRSQFICPVLHLPLCNTLKCWNQDPRQTSNEWGAGNSSFWGRSQCLQISLGASPPLPLKLPLAATFPWYLERGAQVSSTDWSNLFLQETAFLPTGSTYQERDAVHYFALLKLLTVNATALDPMEFVVLYSTSVWKPLSQLQTGIDHEEQTFLLGSQSPSSIIYC